MRVYGVTGWKNAGKTGLMERLVAEITGRGFTVSTVKHAHHAFDVDQPNTDSYRHRVAGASRGAAGLGPARRTDAGVARRARTAPWMTCWRACRPVDLVLIEGFKREPHPKIEAFRAAVGNPLIAGENATIRAVASDTPLALDRPVFDLNDTMPPSPISF